MCNMKQQHSKSIIFVILICTIILYVGGINCVGIGVERDEEKENKWSLESLNPLSWLFPSKSDRSNTESRGTHLPISRRAGLSDIKDQKTYNDLKSDREVKERRKRRRKQPIESLRGPWKRNKSNPRVRERRRRRRKQQADRDYQERKVSHHMVENRFVSRDEYEEYYDENKLTLLDPKHERQYDPTSDLVISDYDLSENLEPQGRANDNYEEKELYPEEEFDYPTDPSDRKKRKTHRQSQRQSTYLGVTPRISTSRGDLTFFGQGVARPSAGCICRCDCCDCCPCQEGDLIYVDK